MSTISLNRADKIAEVMKDLPNGVATLKELYNLLSDMLPHSLREAIYRDKKKRFKKVAKGVWALKGAETMSLLVEGNGRDLEEVEDASIDAIITDHPWLDKKAHKSGNQKNFAEYDAFKYTQEDFDAKARVLKDGAYCIEFIPAESFSNYEYLYEMKQMAKKAGLNYYAKITWQKTAGVNDINTGRTTKGFEDILVFYKGKKPRVLSTQVEGKNRKAYSSREILPWRVEYPVRVKDKTHQAMKPIELYQFLIEQFTGEYDVCLDQFGGSCNLAKAAVNTKRFGIVYELCSKFINSAVERFGCIQLFNNQNEEEMTTVEEETTTEILEISIETNEPSVEQVEVKEELPTTDKKKTECQLFVKKCFDAICLHDSQTLRISYEVASTNGWKYLQHSLNLDNSITSFEQLEIDECKNVYYTLLPILERLNLKN